MNAWQSVHNAIWGLVVLAAFGCDPGYSDSPADTGAEKTAQGRGGAQIGAAAPDFQLWNLEGDAVTLASQQGRVVMLNFWATWCGPCRVEMPAMEVLYQQFHRKDFEILAISTDAQGAAVTRPFRDSMGLSFPILHDSDFRVGVTYGTRTLPMTFLVNRRGVITHRIFGARDWQSPEARQMIQTLIQAS
ncbi:MAG: redoxin domain-containing protein [Nitrospiraceae bacterium]